MVNLKKYFDTAQSKLVKIYPLTEAKEISFLLINHLTRASKTDIIVDKSVPDFDENLFDSLLKRLLQFEPIQYVMGKTIFCGHVFLVNQHTLIPRPETEELVQIIIKENNAKSNLKIIDIGTGSGCIPISLYLQLPENEYFGLDISQEALKMASINVTNNQAKITFLHKDILKSQQIGKFDIIVSNPPYVLESDKATMNANVLAYEPHSALFVPDNDALQFYEAILKFAVTNLNPKGSIYFEIHESKGNEMMALMKKYHFQSVRIEKDFNNKARFAIGTYIP